MPIFWWKTNFVRWKLETESNFVKMFRIMCSSKFSDDSVLIPLYPPRNRSHLFGTTPLPTPSNFLNQKLSSALLDLPMTKYKLRLLFVIGKISEPLHLENIFSKKNFSGTKKIMHLFFLLFSWLLTIIQPVALIQTSVTERYLSEDWSQSSVNRAVEFELCLFSAFQ